MEQQKLSVLVKVGGGVGGGVKMMSSEVKYYGGSWCRGGRDELVRSSYDWQIGNLKLES